MKLLKNTILLFSISMLLVACFGDQKTVVGKEFGDTSFVNGSFKTNKKDFAELPQNLCEFLNDEFIIKAYENATSVRFDDKSSFMNKNCQFTVIYFDDDTQFIRGSMFVNETQDEGDGWKEGWEMKKKRFKSATYVADLGMVAIWIDKQRKLEIKMKGYDVMITVPPKMQAKNQMDNESSVKDVAIAIAKSSNLF